jgi:hypothetical protein
VREGDEIDVGTTRLIVEQLLPMDVAIRGDRASCLSLQLGPRSWLFAVARGFGTVDGAAAAPATLERLRAECERRLRTERL